MTKRKTTPKGALLVSSYDKLETFADKFAEGHFNLLIIVGGAGLAKSQTLRQAMGDAALWIEGSATAFGIYQELWKHRHRPVVIDDVDALYSDRAAIRLLKCLCQTDPIKSVSWFSGAVGDDKGVPRQFETTSKVVIIANDWKTLSENVYAVQNRGHLILFEPDPAEVHRKVAEWFWDEEIFAWIGQHLHLLPGITMRHYVRASELKDAGMDWFDVMLSEGCSPKTLLVARLREDSSYADENARIQAFKEMGGGGRTTYFNHAKKLKTPAKTTPLTVALRNPGRPMTGRLRVVGGPE